MPLPTLCCAPLDALRAARVRTVKQIQRMTLLDRERAAHVLAELQAEQPETPQVKPARPLLIFYTSIGAALALVIASVSVVMYFRTPTYTHDTAQSQTFVIAARTHRQEPVPVESTLAAAAISTHAPEQEETVYITSCGKRYHKATCFQIQSRSTHAVSISEAAALEKTPCKCCFCD